MEDEFSVRTDVIKRRPVVTEATETAADSWESSIPGLDIRIFILSIVFDVILTLVSFAIQ